RRRGVVIRDPEEESSTKTPAKTKSKDKGKGILVEEPKTMKKKQQVEMDEAFERKLQEEFNQEIDWEVAMEHVKQSAKESPYVQRLDYFKEMSYDDIRLIFEAKFNSNLKFLLKTKEHIEEEESRAIAIINETPAQKAAKRRRLDEEAKDVEELKQHLEIVPDEDDDVFTEATPLARKVRVMDYQIIHVDNKPQYKIIQVVAAVSEIVSAAAVVQVDIPTAPVNAAAVMTTAAPVKVAIPSSRRRRRGVVIRDPEEESSTKTPAKTKSKDKGKGILVEEPKTMKKKQQVEMDEAFERKLQEEFNQEIDWEVAMEHVKQSAKESPYVQRYQVMKKRHVTEAQARRNMMVYLKNTAGYRLDYFKEMSYDDIRLIFEEKFNSNLKFLLKTKEQIEEEKSRAIAIINETPAQNATKRRRLNEKAEDVEGTNYFTNSSNNFYD
nr:hypothetical protein [Tanacetum cinerariifolium]